MLTLKLKRTPGQKSYVFCEKIFSRLSVICDTVSNLLTSTWPLHVVSGFVAQLVGCGSNPASLKYFFSFSSPYPASIFY